MFAIRLHAVSRGIPSQSECLNGCVVPLQLGILRTTRGEIVQAEGVYNCCSCSLKCSDLQGGNIEKQNKCNMRKISKNKPLNISQYIQCLRHFDANTSVLCMRVCMCVCVFACQVWKRSCSRGSSSDHQGLQLIRYRPYPMWARKAWAVYVPLGQE